MNFYEILKPITVNNHYMERYLKFLDYCSKQKLPEDECIERHHVLPVSLFPEFKKNKDNIIKLSARQHFLVHWMLAKFTNATQMWFAFNQMKRVGYNSILYEYARKRISVVISESNSGRIRSAEHMDAIKRSFIGKRPGKNIKNGTVSWEPKDDPRWLTGELVSPRKGYRHNDETKEKIGSVNRGKKMYQDSDGKIKMFFPELVPEGYKLYDNPLWHESTVDNTYWAHNKKTGEELRIDNKLNLPKGFCKGRLKHEGFKNINNSGKLKYVDLYSRKYVFLASDMVDNTRHVRFDGQTLENIVVLIHNNFVIVGIKYILEYLRNKNIFLSREEINLGYVKRPHHNNRDDVFLFREKFQNKELKNIGVNLYNLKDFVMSDEYTIWENI